MKLKPAMPALTPLINGADTLDKKTQEVTRPAWPTTPPPIPIKPHNVEEKSKMKPAENMNGDHSGVNGSSTGNKNLSSESLDIDFDEDDFDDDGVDENDDEYNEITEDVPSSFDTGRKIVTDKGTSKVSNVITDNDNAISEIKISDVVS